MTRPLAAACIAALIASLVPGTGSAQYAGSNVTGTAGLIAVDKVGNKIRFYDPATLRETKVIDGPVRDVHELAISYDHKKAFVPIYGDGTYRANRNPGNQIVVVDLVSQEIEGMIDLGEAFAPHGIVATRDGKLWTVTDQTNRLLLVDPVARRVEASYAVPGVGSHFLTILPDESKIYVSNKESAVNVFDVKSRTFVKSIPLSRETEPGRGRGSEHLTPTADGRRLIVADNAVNASLRVVDTATDEEIASIPLRDRNLVLRTMLLKLMFSPDGRTLVATDYGGGQAWLIDAADYTRQTVIPVAKGPQGIAFAPDSRSVLVSSHDSGLLTRIDLTTQKATGVLPGGSGIEVLAYY